MNKKGFTLVEIMIVVAIIALLAAIAIPNLLRARISANEALAQSTLRAISTAAESFASAQDGSFPTSVDQLTDGDTPYLNKDYCALGTAQYAYTCTFGAAGYTIVAAPIEGVTARSYQIRTGGVLTPVSGDGNGDG